ncbi:30S ribosome-binding factor RbfA [Thermostichus vulcanus]|uniref:Ribosome-binding factor A n=1 Tax=Thermostichus vulcanus str. 'Rupite' TaxID=2813851 RepID=A0ABT0CG52_THEVL|nr:30S ribosome-binding factor RbfA [Thermostichus vulcanus]MCJ2544405.1 30S ribosome-binding factor RbfA [Thermostichus vulcanus str. 'Rupite']
MATGRRVARVAELIKREVSQILLSQIKDDRVGAGMVSIVDVEVSNDLQNARIFVSIYGDETAQQQTMQGLEAATPFVRREIGHRLSLRRVPVLVFLQDRSLERGSRVLSLLSQLKRESEARQRGSQLEVEDRTGGEAEELSHP